jgi:hypothetical protein
MKIRTTEEKYDGIPNPFKRDVGWPISYTELDADQQKLVSVMYDFEEQRQVVERMKEEIVSISSDLSFVSKELQRICFDE